MSSSTRRTVMLAAIGLVAWYVCVFFLWAIQPLSDSVPIGIDYSLSTPKQVSQTVDCNTLFESSARDDVPLPTLNEQPADKPPLTYSREACVDVQQDARIVFVLNTVFVVVALAGLLMLTRRLGKPHQDPGRATVQGPDLVDSDAVSVPSSV